MADEKYRLQTHTAAELDELLTKLGELYSKEELDELIAAKVDKAEGMGLSEENFTNVLKTALETINAAFPFSLQRGEYTLNDQSELTFDTLADTKYYRYTASAIGNPVSGGYGIIINIRYTAYAVQILFSQTTATAPTQMLYRIGTNMSTTPTWRDWQTVSTGSGGGGATIDTLWSDSNGATVGTAYTMAGNISDYDVIYLNTSTRKDLADLNQYVQFSVLTSMIESSTIGITGYYQRYMQVAFNGTNFTVLRASAGNESETDYAPILYKIVGIKY